jgi:isocitrate/isopropylmalate dehydrogenase
MKKKITVTKGDGIGPEIRDIPFRILKAAGAEIAVVEIEMKTVAKE